MCFLRVDCTKKTSTTAILINSGQYLAASQLLQLLGFQEHIGQILHNESNYGIRIKQQNLTPLCWHHMKQMPHNPKIKWCQRAHSLPSIILEGANSASFQLGINLSKQRRFQKTASLLGDLTSGPFQLLNLKYESNGIIFYPSIFPIFWGGFETWKKHNHCFETTTGTCLLSNYRSFVCLRLWHGCSSLRPRLPAVGPSKQANFQGAICGCFRDG